MYKYVSKNSFDFVSFYFNCIFIIMSYTHDINAAIKIVCHNG